MRRVVGSLLALYIFILSQWCALVSVDIAYHTANLFDDRLLLAFAAFAISAAGFTLVGLLLRWAWRVRKWL